jgi:hypothetical protein
MENFRRWYLKNQIEITWFLIGWLSLDMIFEFNRGNWGGVAFDAALISVNYFLNKK